MLDERAKLLLKALVERYIADGQPVGSRTLSKASGLDLSPATIRNVMSDLEELGLIASPHTSAGRIPTARGYRLFVDTMLTVQREHFAAPSLAADLPQKVISNAAHLLSSLSQFVGVVMAPRRTSVFRHIEFMRLSERRLLVIIVSPDGDVQNRVIFTESDYTQTQLIEASNFLNANYAGLAIEQVRERLKTEMDSLRSEIAALMQAAVTATSEVHAQSQGDVVISGERNLLSVSDFSSDMGHLRRAFELFEQKAQLMRLLDISSQAEGVRIFIGGESYGRSFRGTLRGECAVRGRWSRGGYAGRDWADANALRQDDPDSRYHFEVGQQRAEPPQVAASPHLQLGAWAVSSVG